MSTGKEAEVTISRPIPASPNRIADVSPGVWQELGLTPDTNVRIYAIVPAKPQTIASQTTAPQATAPQATAPQAIVPQATAPQTAVSSAAKTAQAETSASGNLPTSVKFDNDFIVNSHPVAPSAVVYETRTQTEGTQPAVSYETRPQQHQPAVSYETRPQQAPSAAVYETRPQQNQPAVTYNTRPQQLQPIVKIENSGYQLYASYGTQQAPSAVGYETRPQQAPVNQAEKKPLPQKDKSPMVNEILAPTSRTFVFIDSPSHTPRPSVIIDNWPQSQGRDRN